MPTKVIEHYSQLSGPEKAASLILLLTEEQAKIIFAKLDENEIITLTHTINNLGIVRSNVLMDLLREVNKNLIKTGELVGGSLSVEKLLKNIPKDLVKNILDEVRVPRGKNMWEKLNTVNEDLLLNYLKNEHPQTIAVIFSKINGTQAAKILNMLPKEQALEVLQRLISLEMIQKEIMEDVENTLTRDFMTNFVRTSKKEPLAIVAEIFNNLDRASETEFMTQLSTLNKDAAEGVRSLMFTFEDIKKFDNKSIQILIKYIDKSKLALALKGGDQDLKDRFLKNMPERAAKLLADDMQNLGPVKLKDVEDAQGSLVIVAKDLIQKGEIVVEKDGGSSEMIY